jgi:hypothetical protein
MRSQKANTDGKEEGKAQHMVVGDNVGYVSQSLKEVGTFLT